MCGCLCAIFPLFVGKVIASRRHSLPVANKTSGKPAASKVELHSDGATAEATDQQHNGSEEIGTSAAYFGQKSPNMGALLTTWGPRVASRTRQHSGAEERTRMTSDDWKRYKNKDRSEVVSSASAVRDANFNEMKTKTRHVSGGKGGKQTEALQMRSNVLRGKHDPRYRGTPQQRTDETERQPSNLEHSHTYLDRHLRTANEGSTSTRGGWQRASTSQQQGRAKIMRRVPPSRGEETTARENAQHGIAQTNVRALFSSQERQLGHDVVDGERVANKTNSSNVTTEAPQQASTAEEEAESSMTTQDYAKYGAGGLLGLIVLKFLFGEGGIFELPFFRTKHVYADTESEASSRMWDTGKEGEKGFYPVDEDKNNTAEVVAF
ncbi:unnamed protein product [Amoebophrya sp. A120]|nr:unnamed protein product [Amoebophrya sp. A120]|eukprot:GSA120T00015341001.1